MSSRYSAYPTLLGNRFAPITHAVGFLEAPFTAVIDADREWRRRLGRYTTRPVQTELAAALESLLPLTGPLSRHLWVETAGPWTAHFDNFCNGGDPWSPIPYLSRTMGCRAVAIMWAPQTRRAAGGIRFDLYGQAPVDTLNYTRTVSAINDARWVLTAIGEVEPYEEPSRYLAKHVRDRLTPDMLDRYCRAIAIRPFDESNFGSHAQLVTHPIAAEGVFAETLPEAHARIGIQVQA